MLRHGDLRGGGYGSHIDTSRRIDLDTLSDKQLYERADAFFDALTLKLPDGSGNSEVDLDQLESNIRKLHDTFIRMKNRLGGNDGDPVKWGDLIDKVIKLDSKMAELQRDLMLELMGPGILEAYNVVIREYPFLSEIRISQSHSMTAGYHRADGFRPESISIRLDRGGEHHYADALRDRLGSVRIMENMIGIPEGSMTPDLLKVFILLHEFGHAHDFHVNYKANNKFKDPNEAVSNVRDAEMQSLFIPGYHPSKFSMLTTEYPWSDIVRRFPQIGSMTKEEVEIRQDESYRGLKNERYADQFAANIIRKHWQELGSGVYSN